MPSYFFFYFNMKRVLLFLHVPCFFFHLLQTQKYFCFCRFHPLVDVSIHILPRKIQKKEIFSYFIQFTNFTISFFLKKNLKRPHFHILYPYLGIHIYVTLTMCLLRIVEVFMYLRQNSHRYILGKRAYSSGYGLEYHVDISKRPISSFLILYSCRSFLEQWVVISCSCRNLWSLSIYSEFK